jgi:CRISPR-associated endonuclease/helicase Cas3
MFLENKMAMTRSFRLRPFQQRVFDTLIRKKRNVILQAPTGAGKTQAALSPFVHNLAHEDNALPLTCRYAVPQRVLANQFFRDYEHLAGKIDQSAPTRLEDVYRQIGCRAVAVQTGEQPDDEQMEAALTFCTIDQLLVSFLGTPSGLGLKRANLNVAGVFGSYLVLDEFHLYPLSEDGSVFGARTTVLQMLRLLKETTPFILMTATFSTPLLQRLATLLDAEVISVTDQHELEELVPGRARTFWRSEMHMDAREIVREHRERARNKCTLVVCNTVARAQHMYLQLREAEADGTRVILLHSRFTPADRRALSWEVEQELGPDHWRDEEYLGKDLLVIATQVIEVGLNISVQVLHTENAPASSLIQRAGRCARFAHQQGQVWVYPLKLEDDGSEASTLPYNKDICSATLRALEPLHSHVVGFIEEQELIDAVHASEDTAMLDEYEKCEHQILERIFTSLRTNDRVSASSLIREVEQVQILIHADPNQAIQETPWQWESFGMRPGSLMSKMRWQAWQERAARFNVPVCWEAEPLVQEKKDDEDLDNREKTLYRWKPVDNPYTIPQALMLAFPPELAYYDNKLGFLLLDDQLADTTGYQSVRAPGHGSDKKSYTTKRQSYQEHIAGLVQAYHFRIGKEIRYTIARLEQAMGLENGTIEQAICLAIACHDLGKLDQTWQQWALEWQQLVYQKRHGLVYQLPNSVYCFAKTDYTSDEVRKWRKDVRTKRPNHACESVGLGRKLIGTSLGIAPGMRQEYLPVLRAVCGAIARHHTAQVSGAYRAVRLSPQAIQAAREALAETHCNYHQSGRWSYDPEHLPDRIDSGDDLYLPEANKPKLTRPSNATPQAELETWLYFLVVRALRLSDQRAR